VLGVVAAPALGLTYYAAEGVGAFRRQDGGHAEPIHARPAADPLVVVGSRSHRGDSLDGCWPAWVTRTAAHRQRAQVLPGGGRRGGFLSTARPDLRVGHRGGAGVLETAGGAVTTLDGTPLRYNERDTLLNPHFIAYGDGSRRWSDLF